MTEGSWAILGLPRSHWHCQLENFEWSAVRPRSLEDAVSSFVDEVLAGGDPHMILHGDPGIGKSHLGVGIYRRVVAEFGTQLATWINVPSFCDRVKESYQDQTSPWAEYREARRLVVLDDLLGRELSSHEISQIVYRLIDTAYLNGAAVVINMNQDINEASLHLRPHEMSRILAGAIEVPMSADGDWRRR